LLFVAVRFSWGVASLSRLLAAQRAAKQSIRPPVVTLWYYPSLIAHAFGIFVLCHVGAKTADPNIMGDALKPLGYVFSGLLVYNAAFLITVIPSSKAAQAKDSDDYPIDDGRSVKFGWIVNNLAFAAITLYILEAWTGLAGIVLLLGAMLLNSGLDLGFAARYYVPRR